jgi:hypothetical protein
VEETCNGLDNLSCCPREAALPRPQTGAGHPPRMVAGCEAFWGSGGAGCEAISHPDCGTRAYRGCPGPRLQSLHAHTSFNESCRSRETGCPPVQAARPVLLAHTPAPLACCSLIRETSAMWPVEIAPDVSATAADRENSAVKGRRTPERHYSVLGRRRGGWKGVARGGRKAAPDHARFAPSTAPRAPSPKGHARARPMASTRTRPPSTGPPSTGPPSTKPTTRRSPSTGRWTHAIHEAVVKMAVLSTGTVQYPQCQRVDQVNCPLSTRQEKNAPPVAFVPSGSDANAAASSFWRDRSDRLILTSQILEEAPSLTYRRGRRAPHSCAARPCRTR